MLPPPYEWRITPTSAHLDFRYGCVAFVLPNRLTGKYRSVIQWRGRVHEAPCGSVRQGVRWIERWIQAQGDRMPVNVWRWDVAHKREPPRPTPEFSTRIVCSPPPAPLTMAEMERILGFREIRE